MAPPDSHFYVNPYNDPVVVKIDGKASFQNSSPVKDFFDHLVEEGKKDFVIDFQDCDGMDSTFLGILAGLGIELMRKQNPGSVVLTNLGTRNHELIENLGLHRLLVIDEGDADIGDEAFSKLKSMDPKDSRDAVEKARMCLQAHENLIKADSANESKFQDVISFLRNQVEEG